MTAGGLETGDAFVLRTAASDGFVAGDAVEANAVTRSKLAELPKVRAGNDRGTDEPTEAGAIWPKNHGHVARVVDGTNGIRIVVDIRRMQASLTTVRTSPLRLG